MKKTENNIAFIDSQNLHLWTLASGWKIDFLRFRIYLRDKFHVQEAYIFLGFLDEDQNELYKNLQRAWYIVVFREHTSHMKWKKKGNVDGDIIFEMMRSMFDNNDFDKIVLISWDGDYIKTVKYLIEKWKFKKILFPNSQYSSLYKPLKDNFWLNLSLGDIRQKISYIRTQKKKPF
jgi:uncharacterized LabA/DUF88 family protein